jgi:hypothetical protein
MPYILRLLVLKNEQAVILPQETLRQPTLKPVDFVAFRNLKGCIEVRIFCISK